jgi:phytoene dehydrogenase-like protein
LIEKSDLIGGRFATYDKDGFKLDVGCHMLANCDKGPFGKVLDICGCSDYVKWRYARKPSPVLFFNGERVKFPFEAYKMGFTKEDFRNFMRFYADLVQLSEEDYEKLDQVSISDYVSRYVKSDLAKGLVGYFSSIDFVTRDDETPIGEYARCLNEIARNKAVGYPVGGTGKIPEAYCRIIRERDGRVLTGTAVKKILVEDRKATGVVLANGERQKADLVISNAGIRDTVRFLVGEDKYPQAHTDRIRRYRYSYSTSTIKIALNEKLSSDSMIFYIGRRDLSAFENQMELTGELPDMAPSLMIPVVSNLDPESAPEGKQLMIAGGSCRMPHNAGAVVWKKWEKAIMNSLEVIFPDILEHILWTVATSPEDIDRFAGEDGSVIGIGQMLGQVGDNRPKILDEYVQNLYHCSADTGLHGIGGELAMDAAFRLYKHLG